MHIVKANYGEYYWVALLLKRRQYSRFLLFSFTNIIHESKVGGGVKKLFGKIEHDFLCAIVTE